MLAYDLLQLLLNDLRFLILQVLWPTLLEFIVPMKYNTAAGVVCRSAAFLAEKKQSEDASDYYLDYTSQGK